MEKKIQSALISVFHKEGLEPLVRTLHEQGVTIYTTGGTQSFIEALGLPCMPVEDVTGYPPILGGRVKTLHPRIFGGILGRRDLEEDVREMHQYEIPTIDMVIVDLYPFEQTVASTTDAKAIIEKIDIGGPSMIRAAAKNHADILVVAARADYAEVAEWLSRQKGHTSLDQRRQYAAKAFAIVAHYDAVISQYFGDSGQPRFLASIPQGRPLRYGENPHQSGVFYGSLESHFEQLNGKELSYNNLIDASSVLELMKDLHHHQEAIFAIVKHTNVCGLAVRNSLQEAWAAALAGDPESAFGGVIACNRPVDGPTAQAISDIFFEVLIAPGFHEEALPILAAKKNRILLRQKAPLQTGKTFRTLLGGVLEQEADAGSAEKWEETGGRHSSETEKSNLAFANIVCKHLKSNAIALVKDMRLIGKGCGQTSRIDALRHALEKARQCGADARGAVLASDAFFPFDDCVRMSYEAGIQAFIQPGGSIRDKDSIAFCQQQELAMVITGMRHFRH
ncbi:MAG: bifunctional phosphoribosylaminoimidazolecarboxamide formyltransferase/IMP cyclohydrolase [Bacteroidetes bacterium]|nr:bifunctional phosphoribosylaminoimidazolecarboxamide formyltransferase/IMP cyclohydrolase [Bacteroidota bacterium]